MIFETRYPLPVKQQPPISPTSDIPSSPPPLPSAEPELLGDGSIESKEKFLKARVDDYMARKYGKMKSKRSDMNKRGETSLVQILGEEEKAEGAREPERRTFESSLTGPEVKAPGQPRFLSRETQRTAVDDCKYADIARSWEKSSFFKPLSG